MIALKCDRCGSFYDRYGSRKQANTLYVRNDNGDRGAECNKEYDLCPRCMEEVQAWIAAGKEKQE